MDSMRLLVLGDIHGNLTALAAIIASAIASGEPYDAVICTGDLGIEILDSPQRRDCVLGRHLYSVSIDAVFESLRTLNIPILYVPGNHDVSGLRSSQDVINLDILQDREPFELGGWNFWGIGGCPRTPSEWSYEWEEGMIYPSVIGATIPKGSRSILLSHCPPVGRYCDLNGHGEHLGSWDIRRIITHTIPRVVICGHIHEALCCELIDNSFLVNAGAIHGIRHLYSPMPNGRTAGRPVPRFVYSYFALTVSDSFIAAVNQSMSPVPVPSILTPRCWTFDGTELSLLRLNPAVGRHAWNA